MFGALAHQNNASGFGQGLLCDSGDTELAWLSAQARKLGCENQSIDRHLEGRIRLAKNPLARLPIVALEVDVRPRRGLHLRQGAMQAVIC
jgi:hypothetical protein